MCSIPEVFGFAQSLEFCRTPTQQEILSGTSNYGRKLSQENRDRATKMAVDAVNADCAANPELYSSIPGSCSYVDPSSNSWLPVLIAAGVVILLIWAKK